MNLKPALIFAAAYVAVLVVVVVALVGCAGVSNELIKYEQDNPGSSAVLVGDTYYVDNNRDGVADEDANGKVTPLPGPTEELRVAGEVDKGLGELAGLLAAFGIPGASLASAWFFRRSPVKRANIAKAHVKGLVNTIGHVKAVIASGQQLTSVELRDLLTEFNSGVAGLNLAIGEARGELAEEKALDKTTIVE